MSSDSDPRPMNAERLLEAMKAGAIVKVRPIVKGAYGKRRRGAVLWYKDGTMERLQVSALDALIHRHQAICSEVWTGDKYTYIASPEIEVKP